MKYSIAIDPGKTGAIAVISEAAVKTFVFQLIAKEVDIHKLVEIILAYKNQDCHLVLEDVHSIFGASAKSNFSFGHTNGLIEGVLISHGIPFTKVQPKAWQKEMWQGVKPVEINTGKKTKDGNIKYKIDTKATSLLACKRLFPGESLLATERSKVPHDGIVDSLLMAAYCKRKF